MRVERRLSRSSVMIGMAMEEVRYFLWLQNSLQGEEYVRRNTDSMFGWTWRSLRISASAFLGMSCVLERVVPHPKGFTGNSGSFPPQLLGRSFVVRANFVGKKQAKKVD